MTALFTRTDSVATAQLIFAGERFVSLPKVSEMVGQSLCPGHPIEMEDVTLTSVLLQHEKTSLILSLAFEGKETVLNMSLRMTEARANAAAVELIRLCHKMASQLPISCVTWADQPTRIPRSQFVDALQNKFPRHAPADVDEIAPRRVTNYASRKHWDRQEDAGTVDRLYGGAQGSVRAGDKLYDAHIEAYRLHRDELAAQGLRQAMLAENDPQIASPSTRLSSWALTLSAATIALPVALPVLAHNLSRKEDLRSSANGLGLAGLYLALDQSGAFLSLL